MATIFGLAPRTSQPSNSSKQKKVGFQLGAKGCLSISLSVRPCTSWWRQIWWTPNSPRSMNLYMIGSFVYLEDLYIWPLPSVLKSRPLSYLRHTWSLVRSSCLFSMKKHLCTRRSGQKHKYKLPKKFQTVALMNYVITRLRLRLVFDYQF